MGKHKHPLHDLDRPVPYWKRAHTDWKVRTAALFMLVAAIIYVLSGDLSWQPHPLGNVVK